MLASWRGATWRSPAQISPRLSYDGSPPRPRVARPDRPAPMALRGRLCGDAFAGSGTKSSQIDNAALPCPLSRRSGVRVEAISFTHALPRRFRPRALAMSGVKMLSIGRLSSLDRLRFRHVDCIAVQQRHLTETARLLRRHARRTAPNIPWVGHGAHNRPQILDFIAWADDRPTARSKPAGESGLLAIRNTSSAPWRASRVDLG